MIGITPTSSQTRPAAKLAKIADSLGVASQISDNEKVEITVSPAPETSCTLRAFVIIW